MGGSGDHGSIGILGCGYIAAVHLQMLRRVPGVRVAAVCDPARARAESLARRFGVPTVCASVDELLATGVAAVHVLTPPHLHRPNAEALLAAGRHVLVEKPLCLGSAEAEALGAAATRAGRVLGVNHNLVFSPGLRRLDALLAEGRLGRIEEVQVLHNVPVRQLQTGDVGHFMFGHDAAILWEQGVHLFSVVHHLLGPASEVRAHAGEPRPLAHGVVFRAAWDIALRCARGSASLRLAFGRSMPESRVLVVCSDGTAEVDLLRGTCAVRGKTRWLDFLDQARGELGVGLHHLAAAWRGLSGYGRGLFGLGAPSDPYLASMLGSIAAFHAAVANGTPPPCTAADAAEVLRTCERAAAAAAVPTVPPTLPPVPAPGPARPGEVVVLGGTGLIGRAAVAALRQAGRPVTLLVRRPALLPAALRDGSVRIFQGDAADPPSLAAVCAGADTVLHLATCAGDDPAGVERAMAAAVQACGEACRQAGVRRLVYTSSTAAMYLGGRGPVPGDAPADPRPALRPPYSRAKIAAERAALDLRRQGLDVVIVRPAIVLGSGAPPEHSGVGLWVRDNHCVGWGLGRTPLPFVLVADCAQALVAALHAEAAANGTYALAGPVRPTAREYFAELRARTGRAYHYHPQGVWWTWLQEAGKHLIKAVARRPRELMSMRDLRSRGFRAALDCSAAERDLGFRPERDRAAFLDAVFGPGPRR